MTTVTLVPQVSCQSMCRPLCFALLVLCAAVVASPDAGTEALSPKLQSMMEEARTTMGEAELARGLEAILSKAKAAIPQQLGEGHSSLEVLQQPHAGV